MDETDREKRKQLLKTIQSGSINKLKDSVGFNVSQILAFKVTENWDMEKAGFSLS
jgi:hypothetical protein